MNAKIKSNNLMTVERYDGIITRLQTHITSNNHHDFTAKKRLEKTIGRRAKLIKTKLQEGEAK